jgi:hypothetical protein
MLLSSAEVWIGTETTSIPRVSSLAAGLANPRIRRSKPEHGFFSRPRNRNDHTTRMHRRRRDRTRGMQQQQQVLNQTVHF